MRFHGVPHELATKIHKYVDYAFAVTKGINVESIAGQLPPHLQLEVYLHLNRQMVMQVSLFHGCDDDFYRALVMKLPATATEAELRALFEPHGNVKAATIMKEPDGTPKGFGFVTMDDDAKGRAAVAAMKVGATVQGQAVAVSEMKM